jgi:DNA-binding NtrC family response regulator
VPSGLVLVVDDDTSVRGMVRLILNRVGYEVALAKDGDEAIQFMSSPNNGTKVTVLICDLDMPSVAGSKVIDYVHRHYPLIPILIVSGASDFVLGPALVQQRASKWIKKPASREKLLEKVNRAARLYELRKTRSAS